MLKLSNHPVIFLEGKNPVRFARNETGYLPNAGGCVLHFTLVYAPNIHDHFTISL